MQRSTINKLQQFLPNKKYEISVYSNTDTSEISWNLNLVKQTVIAFYVENNVKQSNYY